MTHFSRLIAALTEAKVDFTIVGGVALVSRGGSRATNDLDIVYSRAPDNLERLVAALSPLHPRLRGAPADLPFYFDARTLRSGLNFNLVTDLGEIDLLGDIAGLGDYAATVALSSRLPLFGATVFVLDLDGLELTKRAAGRAKDLLDLEVIRDLKTRG